MQNNNEDLYNINKIPTSREEKLEITPELSQTEPHGLYVIKNGNERVIGKITLNKGNMELEIESQTDDSLCEMKELMDSFTKIGVDIKSALIAFREETQPEI